jgi:quinohemoprotein ethanol dehydrogenase
MSRQTHDEFLDIVLGGKRAKNGMASFADTLTKEQAELVHKFIIARINEDWQELNKTN